MKPKPKKQAKKKTSPAMKSAPYQPDDYLISNSIGIQQVQREVARFEMRHSFDKHEIDGSRFGLKASTFMDYAAQQMILQLKATIASKKFDTKTVRFPDGAWQFVKLNLQKSPAYGIKAVQWFLKKYPVRWVEITMEANAYHPDIAIPDHDTYVNIAVMAKRDGHY
jgi:hypothetical protein